jgi:hypothetical protein
VACLPDSRTLEHEIARLKPARGNTEWYTNHLTLEICSTWSTKRLLHHSVEVVCVCVYIYIYMCVCVCVTGGGIVFNLQ